MRALRTLTVAALALLVGVAATGCSSEGDDMASQLENLGGQTVDDLTITKTVGEPTINVGGLPITLDYFTTYALTGSNITTPPTWPTLDDDQANSNTEELATIGLATLAQTELVTNDDTRAELIRDGFAVAGMDDFELVHRSATFDDTTGNACWAETRRGDAFGDGQIFDRSVIMIAGPGIASSGIIIWQGWDDQSIVTTLSGDIIEQVCNQRPTGL